MSTAERDTHFQGFANLLWEEMKQQPFMNFADDPNAPAAYEQHMKNLIAQRAYDLARHAIDCTAGGYYASHYLREGEDMADVPDLTSWPESKE